MKYHVTIMSIDPDLSDEDNHQKYGYTVEAENENEAIKKAKEKLDGLPVFWVRCQKL